jgi:hypothetical protein
MESSYPQAETGLNRAVDDAIARENARALAEGPRELDEQELAMIRRCQEAAGIPAGEL